MTAPRPRVGLVLGDPSGIGPEILAKTLAESATLAACRAFVIGDARILARGAAAAGVALPPRVELMDLKNCPPDEAPLGRATARTGKAAGEALEFAVRMAKHGDIDAIVYAPLHKRALHEAGYGFEDELHLLALQAGVYRVAGTGGERRIAFNIPPLPAQRWKAGAAEKARLEASPLEDTGRDLWRWLVLLSLIPLWVEWRLFHRSPRNSVENRRGA